MASGYSPLAGGGGSSEYVNFWVPWKTGKIYSIFIRDLRKAAVSTAAHTAVDRQWITNWKGCVLKRRWPNLRHSSGICLEGPGRTWETPIRVFGRCPGQLPNGSRKSAAETCLTCWGASCVADWPSTYQRVQLKPFKTKININYI